MVGQLRKGEERLHEGEPGATLCREWMPHTWLSPAAPKSYASTVSLRHVRGSPALGLLRRLRPLSETSPNSAACCASHAQRSDQGSRVHRRNPWCGRWPTLPLATLAGSRSGARDQRAHVGRTQSLLLGDRARVVYSSLPTRHWFVQRVQASASGAQARDLLVFTMAPAVARLGRRAPLRSVQTVRLLQAAGPIASDVHGPLLRPVRPGRG